MLHYINETSPHYHLKFAFCNQILVESVTIGNKPTNNTLYVGDTHQLSASITPSDAYNKNVTWSSSNEDVATVNASGKITAVGVGTTVIKVKTNQGNLIDSFSLTVYYCGGTNYRDVTKHTMNLQDDGYYVCSKCKYRAISPALQDKEILSTEDYYKVYSCYLAIPYYATLEQNQEALYIPPETLLGQIDEIRSKEEYCQKYDYVDGNGIYYKEHNVELNAGEVLDVDYVEVNNLNIGLHNGVYEGLAIFIVGLLVPSPYKEIFLTATSDTQLDDSITMLSYLAEKANYGEIGIILDLISFGCVANDNTIAVTDKIVYIKVNSTIVSYETKIVFNKDGELKTQHHSYIL